MSVDNTFGHFIPRSGRAFLKETSGSGRRRLRAAKILTLLYILPFFVNGFFVKNVSALSEVAQQSGNIGNYIFLMICCGSSIAIFMYYFVQRTPRDNNVFTYPFIFLALLFLLEVTSAIWSSTPSGTVYHTAPSFISLLYVAAITSIIGVSRFPQEDLYEIWCFAIKVFGMALLLLIVSAFSGDDGFRSAFGEAYSRLYGTWFGIHPNVSSLIATICTLHYLAIAKRLKPIDFLLLAISCLVLILSRDRTQYATVFLALFLLSFQNKKIRLFFIVSFVILGSVILTQYEAALHYISRGRGLDSLTSLTGRIDLWSAALDFAFMKFWFGWGGWAGAAVDFNYSYATMFPYKIYSNIDNTFMQVFVDCGAVGLALFGGFLFSTLWKSFRAAKTSQFQMMGLVANIVIAVKAMTGIVVVSFDATQIIAVLALLISMHSVLPALSERRIQNGKPLKAV